jgi:integrase
LAAKARRLIREGIDPQVQRDQLRQEQERLRLEHEETLRREAATGTLDELFEWHIQRLKANGRMYWREVERGYKANIRPVVGGTTKARDVTEEGVVQILARLKDRDALVYANRVRSYLHAAFEAGRRHDLDPNRLDTVRFYIAHNPVANVPRPQKNEKPCDRTLDRHEIRTLWRLLVVSRMSYATQSMIKLALLTGQRIKEILGMRWDEIDMDQRIWILPNSRTKPRREHTVPLTPTAMIIIKRMQRYPDTDIYLFPKLGDRHAPMALSSVSRAINRLCSTTEALAKFTPRDIRRTVKTLMGDLGISKETRDRIQNHALNDVSTRHYDRYDYLKEKRTALEAWDRHLMGMLRAQGRPSNIVSFTKPATK